MAVVIGVRGRIAWIPELHLQRRDGSGRTLELSETKSRGEERQKDAALTVVIMICGQGGKRAAANSRMVADFVYMPANIKEN